LQQRQKIKMEVKQLQEAMDPFNLEYATSERQKIKMEVKQLQEAMDPFNLEYATSGNWWQLVSWTCN